MKYINFLLRRVSNVKNLSRKQALLCGAVIILVVAGGGVAIASRDTKKPEATNHTQVAQKDETHVQAATEEATPAPQPAPTPQPSQQAHTKPATPKPAPAPAPAPTKRYFPLTLTGNTPNYGYFHLRGSESPTGYIVLLDSTDITPALSPYKTVELNRSLVVPNREYSLRVCTNVNGSCGTSSNVLYVTYKTYTCGANTNVTYNGVVTNPCKLEEWTFR